MTSIFSRDWSSVILMLSTCFLLSLLDHKVTFFQSYSILLKSKFQVSNLLQYPLSKGCGTSSYVLIAFGSSAALLSDFRVSKIIQLWLKILKPRKNPLLLIFFFLWRKVETDHQDMIVWRVGVILILYCQSCCMRKGIRKLMNKAFLKITPASGLLFCKNCKEI